MVLVVIPNFIAIKVSRKYTTLRRQMRRSTGRAYPIAKLRQNIANALSINGGYVGPHKLKEPLYKAWVTNIYKVLPYNYWFYAVQLIINPQGEVIARVVDALYEGDYHNDTMQTKPYESKVLIKRIISETISKYISNMIK